MKKAAILFAMLCAGLAANASYLYWQVTANDYANITEPGKVTAVNVWAVKDNGEKTFVDGYRASSGTAVNMAEAQMIDVSAFSTGNYSFYIELANYSSGYQNLGNTVDGLSYAEMVEKNYIMDTPLSVTQATVWHGTPVAAPEPVSGVMVLVGLGLLALKRRKA